MSRKFALPEAPSSLRGRPVRAWAEAVIIPTYEPHAPDRNPMFLEKRVYQGSSGKVYPLPFTDRIATTKSDRAWKAIHLENEYVRLMVLPELGGRIHVGLDRTNGYDFFYRQNVIKPALVGLAGPWISGGVEFNWPQHHRPSTFMPADSTIEEHADGSVTVWCSEHEPMGRMKGMHGVCLHPGRSVVELKVRLHNRTELTQTFLWWANAAARVHERYQSFFPEDVRYVADHAKRATSRFPLCEGVYYGVDYGRRGREGVPAEQVPERFVPPPGMYAPNDLSWYANIPVPTSYMAMGSSEDFFGGYDHAAEAGVVHVADHRIAPGKKQWTWGNHAFGYAWDRNLTDEDGPYIELMAGVFTDNQPDFSFLAPGETRTWSQFWYPIRKIGPAQKASTEAAISLKVSGGIARVGVAVTRKMAEAEVAALDAGGKTIASWRRELSPASPLVEEMRAEAVAAVELREGGRQVLTYRPRRADAGEVPPPATEPPPPERVGTVDELYLTGLHLEQYRHATRMPEPYWREALKRDPGESRCNVAMGWWHYRRGEFEDAERHFRRAIERLTARNPNPRDGEAHYGLGVTLVAGRARRHPERSEGSPGEGEEILRCAQDDAGGEVRDAGGEVRDAGGEVRDAGGEAYDALAKAAWNEAWQAPAWFEMARLQCVDGHWPEALELLDRCLGRNADHARARHLKAMVLRELGRAEEADALLRDTLAADPLDFMARFLLGRPLTCDTQVRMDLSLDLAAAGFHKAALAVLEHATPADAPGSEPLLHYYRAFFASFAGRDPRPHLAAARRADPAYCFPARLTEIAVLRFAIEADPADARARYYLGNLYYDRRRHEEAIALWEESARLDPTYSVVWRNLAIGSFNVRRDAGAARAAYDRAVACAPDDARLLYERDQLWKRLGESPQRRLAELEKRLDLVGERDDLSIELAALYNQTGRPESALAVLCGRHFQPWEGGEGMALAEHVRTHLALGQASLRRGDAKGARALFEAALACPENLGEARHLLANVSDVHYWTGVAAEACGDGEAARRHWTIAAESRGDFQEMSVRACSEMTYYSARALRALGREEGARDLLRGLLEHARGLMMGEAKVEYFATSLPTMLLFEDDLARRQRVRATVMMAQAHLGLGDAAAGRDLLRRALADDPDHALASRMLSEAEAETEADAEGPRR